ncbi:hypothetical protein NQ318_022307 [Aromia moschata]|uniref:Uncharacterized protein n=1 Tax=Aromia moschata TaxID=1265417 RepID=A0AAV8Z692_9CUCU|nr:hypothetical protein NQ318_022307 [Aromia moschata]
MQSSLIIALTGVTASGFTLCGQPPEPPLPALKNFLKYNISQETFKIGRSDVCDVVINESASIKGGTISKVHCMLKKGPHGTHFIVDLSKNGTFVNGKLVGKDQMILIKDNDTIAVGKQQWNIYMFNLICGEELPDTLTSSDSSLSLTPRDVLPIWGRLHSCILHLRSFDLCHPTFKVGRSSCCDAIIDQMDIDPKIKNMFSKEQFIIVKDADNPLTYIVDISSTGTYLNGQLIGKNCKNILQCDDRISVGKRKKRVFVYKPMYSSESHSLPVELRAKYVPCKFLGKGACGEVRLALEKRTCRPYAIKNILKGRSTLSQIHELNHPLKIETEINILRALSHPFVVQMEEIVETEDEVFIVLEYMRGGDLSNRILSNVPLTESNVKYMFYQMVLAVEYLHSRGITHRDLKPENILLSSDEPETLVKISDFGLSKVADEDTMMKTICATWPPEVLSPNIQVYDEQVDVWSLGVIVFYMLSKKLPFRSSEPKVMIQLVIQGAYKMEEADWQGVSYEARDLVKRMLTVNPQTRITIDEILKHPWLAKDIPMLYRVQSLLDGEGNQENVTVNFDAEPPTKRVKISDEFTD